MITRIEALYYRSLRYICQDVGRYQVLVGPNASGKSTFLDVVAFLGDLVRAGLPAAVEGDQRLSIAHRAPDAQQLVWMRLGDRFELAIELEIPEHRRARLKNDAYRYARYEVAIGTREELAILSETLWLRPEVKPEARQRTLFPMPPEPPESLVVAPRKRTPPGWKKVVARGEDVSNVTFLSETSGWNNPFRIKASRAALANLPEDEVKFPVATWVKETLTEGVQRVVLSSEAMRRPCPPGRARAYLPDGSNLPWVVADLEKQGGSQFQEWLEHLRETLPDLVKVTTRERPEDRHRYLVLTYGNGLEAPSWLVSDGTLRLLALTLLSHIPGLTGIYLIEEPENGVHPRAVEAVFQSLGSVYDAQVLVATHSAVAVNASKPEEILCFARDPSGATDIVRGDRHPRLKQWRGEVDLGTLFAGGVLG